MRWIAILVCLLAPTIATAQTARSTYVGGSLLGEFARFGGVDFGDDDVRIPSTFDTSMDADTLGFDVTVGRALGERWGVELQFARGGNSDRTSSQRMTLELIELLTVLPPGFPIPDFLFELRTRQQNTTVAATAWMRQELSARVDLAFLGGVSFNRIEAEQEIRVADPRFGIFLPVPREIEAVQYGVGPVIGTDAIIDFGNRVSLTTGVRLHGLEANGVGGWLIRPAVGVRWRF